MSKKASILLLILIAGYASVAQTSLEKVAMNRIEKKKWLKAEQTLKKSIRKDTLNASAKYVFALWYYDTTNPRNNVDSSYVQVQKALEDYERSDERLREKMSRFPLDSTILVQLRQRIEHSAFEKSKILNTEEAYNYFIEAYSLAKEIDDAMELRDEVSFLNALKINTYASFQQYFTKYPKSHRAEEARGRYEKLLFEDKTRDGKLRSYKSFYNTYESSPYRPEVLERIFDIETASGSTEDFVTFLENYPSAYLSERALDYAYHISLTLESDLPGALSLNDSLRMVAKSNAGYLVPFLTGNQYGFMNEDGEEILSASYSRIMENYLCGNIEEDYLVVEDKIINRQGKLIAQAVSKNIEDIGFGYLLVEQEDCHHLIHKSGYETFKDCVDDVKIIANRFLAVKKSRTWGLYAFNGNELLASQYEDIASVDDIIVFVKGGKKIINTIAEVTATADQIPLPDVRVFDEVRKLNSQHFLVRNGALQGVIDAKLNYIIPLNRQVLSMTSFGFVKKVNEKVTTIGINESLDKEEFKDILPYGNWLGLYNETSTRLYHQPSGKVIADNLDSLWFSNKLAMSKQQDSIAVYFGSGRRASFSVSNPIHFIKSRDSIRHFYIAEKNKKDVFEVESGIKLFRSEFESIEYIGEDLFLITLKGKKGIISKSGKSVLEADYEAIVRTGENILSLLKDKKFGLFYLNSERLIEAKFERNLSFYSESILVAFSGGYYGFIDEDAKQISDFMFEEVRPWSDSLAMVKINYNWMVYDLFANEIIMNGIKDYRLIKNEPSERIAIIYKDNKYGVVSSKRGIIISPTFTEIVNLGTAQKPFYFTEKHVEEAEVFIIIYYDSEGTMKKRAIYELDDYDRIYCQ